VCCSVLYVLICIYAWCVVARSNELTTPLIQHINNFSDLILTTLMYYTNNYSVCIDMYGVVSRWSGFNGTSAWVMYVCMCVNIYIYICIYIGLFMHVCVCIYVYIYIYIYMCLCVCVYIYKYSQSLETRFKKTDDLSVLCLQIGL